MTRHELAARQQDVLRRLLRGELPDGFDPRSAALTSRVLRTKRRSEAVAVEPALKDVPDFVDRFDAWATDHPRRGCAHDDVVDFLTSIDGPLPEPLASVRAIERVYRGETSFARDRRPDQRPVVLGVGGRVWHLGRRGTR